MIHLDTSVLIAALTGPRELALPLRRAIAAGERLALSSLVLYEWRRGPRTADELADQEALLPAEGAVPFGPLEARRAAVLYKGLRKGRGREIDIAIAACAIAHRAALWTLNPSDFRDLPGLSVYVAR
ncbi:MAG TPA: PIN domain-containing protein [Vicinamibacterales bacterium]|nr:PIN domain-containing protein [Vicinamibacterales bacterium]